MKAGVQVGDGSRPRAEAWHGRRGGGRRAEAKSHSGTLRERRRDQALGEMGWRGRASLQRGKLRHGGSTGDGGRRCRAVSSLCVPQLLGCALSTPRLRNQPCGGHRGLQGSGGSSARPQQKGSSSGVTGAQEPGWVWAYERVLVGRRAASY